MKKYDYFDPKNDPFSNPDQWRKVTKKEFLAAIGKVNCHPSVHKNYHDPDYGSFFVTQMGFVVGRTVQWGETPNYKPNTHYFLPVDKNNE